MNENINKIIYGTSTLIDLTEDTVHPDRMYKGDIAHAADGSIITGTAEITVDNTTLIMPEGLCELLGTVDPETHHWIRPDFLPDLDSIYNGELNTLYMTIDATGRIPDPHVSIKVWCTSGNYTIQIGHISNNTFVVDTTETKANTATWTKSWTPTQGLYPVVKITADHLRATQLQAWTSGDGHAYVAQYQPIIEWIGDFENADSAWRTPYFTEYEKISTRNVSSTAALQNRWNSAYSLQEVDVSGWTTTNWNITSLSATFQWCCNLASLDLSAWDTSNWAINNMSNTWEYCFVMENLDISTWDTSKWKVTNINATWSNCLLLRSLDLRHFNTSGWPITSIMNYTWYNCCSLENLDVSTWDTSGWKVPTMAYTWQHCFALTELNVSTWDTSGWNVTSMNNTFDCCYKLASLPIENWNTTNWHVTGLATTWYCCYSLESLDLSNWDTSNWAVTSLANTWNSCFKMKQLDVSTWNTTNWTVTSLASTWNGCRSITNLNLKNWNTSNWVVTTMANTWNSCYALKSLSISNWNVSNWRITTMVATFNWCSAIKEIDLSSWDTSAWPMTAVDAFGTTFRECINLVTMDLSFIDLSKFTEWRTSSWGNENNKMTQNIILGASNNEKINSSTRYPVIRFDWCTLLTRESILNLFNGLANNVSGKTLQLGSVNLNKLTAEEKAIATNKGWTLT